MNTNYSFIMTAAVLVTSAFAVSITATVPLQPAAADPDRCVSWGFGLGGAQTGCYYATGDNKDDVKEIYKRG